MEAPILVVDNGGYTIKAGLSDSSDPQIKLPNTTGRIRKSLHELIGDETENSVTDHSQIMYHRPIEKGYVVNWDYQAKVWHQLLNAEHMNIEPQDTFLFLSQPLFNMDELLKATFQVVFEHFRFGGFFSSPAPCWTFAKHLSTLPLDDISRHTNTGLVVESGFSFTHIIPIVDGHVILEAVRRINVGGKLLTNLLKETISFRYVNVQDCFHLVNRIKEMYSYLSLDVFRDLEACKTSASKRKVFVLPDYVISNTGYELKLGQKVDPSQQVVVLTNERFMVPEALFHPSDIGIRQAGIGECTGGCLGQFAPAVQELLSQNIVLSGGNTCIPHYKERVEYPFKENVQIHRILHSTQEVKAFIEEGKQYRIFQMNDPIHDTWRGGALLAQQADFREKLITREMYEENGPLRLLPIGFQKESCI